MIIAVHKYTWRNAIRVTSVQLNTEAIGWYNMEVQSIGDIVIRADIRFRIGYPLFNAYGYLYLALSEHMLYNI